MKKLILFSLLLISLKSWAQSTNYLDKTYDEVLNYQATVGGIKTPPGYSKDDAGNITLTYDMTEVDEMGKLFYSYIFKNGKCDWICISFKGSAETYAIPSFNRRFQSAGHNVWYDNSRHIQAKIDEYKEAKSYTVWYCRVQ